MHNIYEKIGVHIPEIFLPVKGTDLTKWSVIACDQYTSQPDYWQKVNDEVDGSPSTLKLTFPEIYLKDDDQDTRINQINAAMLQYVTQGILEPQKPGFILVDRSTPHAASRKGLILAVDLECYDYREGSQTLIRATEGTVLDRIPPRVKIRENAPIELPHIMLLIDDPKKTVIEKLFNRKDTYEKLYDFELMQGGGHIRGWKVEDAESLSMAAAALEKLADPTTFAQKYNLQMSEGTKGDGSPANGDGSATNGDGSPANGDGSATNGDGSPANGDGSATNGDGSPANGDGSATNGDGSPANGDGSATNGDGSPKGVLLFAAGDGNHSLASAKAHWENVKVALAPEYLAGHPARYALVEVVNVHDDGLVFEPIHRVLFGIDSNTALENIKSICGSNSKTGYTLFDTKAALESALESALENAMKGIHKNENIHQLPFILEGTYGLITTHSPFCSLEVGTLQSFIDELVRNNSSLEVDYIHGEQVVTELGSQKGCMGFYLPVMDKHDLFKTVIVDGVLPKKTFSMGEAEEKRYYLECRKIR